MTGNTLGRRAFIDGMAAIGVVACCPRIRAATAAPKADGTFTFAQWNIGHFAMGRTRDTTIRPDESAARLAQYRKLVERIDADFIGLNEYSARFDLAGTETRSAVFGTFGDFKAGPHLGYKCNAIASRTAPLKAMRIGEYSRRMHRAYYMACETEIHGTPFTLVETHLDLASKEMRAAQIGELLRDFTGCPRVILSGDFNIDDEREYAPLAAAGFKMANFGALGSFETHRRGNAKATPCIDNIFAKGFDVLGAWTADDNFELSDHRLLLCRLRLSGNEALDENLVALISDLHVNGRGDEFPDHRHEEKCLRKAVEGILALRPRPAQVVCLGDIAYFWGLPEDYRLAANIIAPLESAGMKISFAMGNHDRRDNFLAQWPGYAKTSPVPGRIVSRVSTPHADLILLDTVNAQPVAFKGKTFPGEIDNAQREWLEAELARTTKPLFVCGHHGMKEDAVRLSRTLLAAKACKGYIHGHWHRWLPQFDFARLNRLLSTACLPSTGHWGDIGFATLRTFPDRAVLALHQTDFFGIKGPGDGHPNRDFILKDRAGAVMTFSLA